MHLDDEILRKLIAFRLTWGMDIDEEWFTALVKARPELVAEVLVTYALALLRTGSRASVWHLAARL